MIHMFICVYTLSLSLYIYIDNNETTYYKQSYGGPTYAISFMVEPPPNYRLIKLYFPHNNEQCWMILGPTFQNTSKIFLNHLFWNIHSLLKHIWVPKLYKYPRILLLVAERVSTSIASVRVKYPRITLRPQMRPLSSVFSRSTGTPIGLFLDNEKRLCSVGPGPEKRR